TTHLIQASKLQGANIKYIPWVKFNELPRIVARSSICLGGPFGDTVQARMVITGKTYQFMASSKPVIIGDNDAAVVFVDKENCLKVKLANPKALAESILWAKENPKKLQEI